MPSFRFSQALTANQRNFNPFATAAWQYEILPYAARVSILVRATGTSVQMTVYSGTETITERSPVQGGGTAGTTPSALNTNPTAWDAPAGDRIKLAIDETGGLTPTVDGEVLVEPIPVG